MESNGYEHHLFQAINALGILAKQAYWHGYCHCGSDTKPECADGCTHYEACKATDKLDNEINILDDWNC